MDLRGVGGRLLLNMASWYFALELAHSRVLSHDTFCRQGGFNIR